MSVPQAHGEAESSCKVITHEKR